MKARLPVVDSLDLQFPPRPSHPDIAFPPGYPLRIETKTPEASAILRDLYGDFEVPGPLPPDTMFTIVPARPPARGFSLRVNGRKGAFQKRLKPIFRELDRWVMRQVTRSPNPYFFVHAGVVTREECGLLLSGHNGVGKSTLALGLVLRGWQYLSDDISAVFPESVIAVPFPRNFLVRRGTRALLSAGSKEVANNFWARPLKPLEPSVRSFVNLNRLWEGSLGKPAKVTHIIFTRYQPDAAPSVTPMGRADVVRRLLHQSWGANTFGRRTVDILADLVGGAECLELTSGRIEQTCKLVEKVCGVGRGEECP